MTQPFEEALTQEMKTIVALGGRVYPAAAPEATAGQGVPYLIYLSSPGLRTKTQDGYQARRVVRGELNVIASRQSDLTALGESVIDMLLSFERRKIGADGPFIQEVLYEQPVELYEPEPKLYRYLIDFEVYF